jgi:hypothetical protein
MSAGEEFTFADVFTYGGLEFEELAFDQEEEDVSAGAEHDPQDPSNSDYSHDTSVASNSSAASSTGATHGSPTSGTSSVTSSIGTDSDNVGSTHATSTPLDVPGAQTAGKPEPDQAIVGGLSDTPPAPVHGIGCGHGGHHTK